MFGFNNNRNTEWIQAFLYSCQYLCGQTFLHLQPSRKNIDNPRQFTQSGNVSIWDISYVCLTKERKHMMLAHGVQLDIFYNYHFADVLSESCTIQNINCALLIALRHKLHGLGHSLRSL